MRFWPFGKRKTPAMLPVKEYLIRIEDVMMLQVPRKAELERRDERHPWRCLSSQKRGNTVEIRFEVPTGLSYLDLEKQTDAISATCGAPIEMENQFGAVMIRIFPAELPMSIPLVDVMAHIDMSKGILMGFDHGNEPVYLSFYEPHVMGAGTSGFGKTAWAMLFLFQLLTGYRSDECMIQVIDLKGTEYYWTAGFSHMLPVVDSITGALVALQRAHKLMKERQRMVKETEMAGDPEPYFPEFYLLIDEAANLAPSQQPNDVLTELALECDAYISEIARIGRSLKFHLVYCTQYPTSKVMNSQIKANVTQRIVFRLPDQVQSLVALDEPGAEELQVKGRAIFKESKGKTILQVPFASKQEYRQLLALHQHFSLEGSENEPKAGNETDDHGGYEDSPLGGYGTDSPVLSPSGPADQKGLGIFEGIGAGKVGKRPTPPRKA